MINAIIIEDEKPIANYIKQIIEEADMGYCVKYVCYTSKEAMKLLENEEIDVAFIDINMPVISGLELVKYINENHFNINTVIVTGERKFEYAQMSIRYNVYEYVLKPIETGEFHRILKGLANIILSEKKENNMIGNRNIKENLLKDGKRKYFALFCIGNMSRNALDRDLEIRVEKVKKKLSEDIYSAFQRNLAWITNGRYSTEIILFMDENVENYLEILKNVFNNRLDELPVYVVTDRETFTMEKFYPTYKKYRKILETDTIMGKSEFFEAKKHSADENQFKMNLEKSISQYSNLEDIQRILRQIFEIPDLNMKNLELLVRNLFLMISQKICTNVNYFEIENELILAKEDSCFLSEYRQRLERVLETYYFSVCRQGNKEEIAEIIKEFIDNNYSLDLSNQQMEDKIGYSSVYIRKIFKEKYNKIPSVYLMEVRMGHAKEKLLRDVPVAMVAAEVGYRDPLYFSKVFKKMTGCSPSEYKKTSI